ncbi:MAG: LpxL/LpxP family Kdo(2)-lipid IV(A) lauroyl/palmitoleoyl acyltransferase [Gammaproteobacteria bacterium]
MTDTSFPASRFLSPRYWPLWIGFGITWSLARLPYAWLMRAGRMLGRLLLALPGHRRHVASVNLALCFPELTDAQRYDLLRRHFESLGMGMMEIVLSWWASPARLRPLAHVEGVEHLDMALNEGRGVILLMAHFTTVEIATTLLAMRVPLYATYRPHNNALFEEVMRRARQRHGSVIDHGNIRAMLRALKNNKAVWYSPDQDYSGNHSVFVPFFGVSAATMTATAELARLGNASVIPIFPERLPGDQGYRITLQPALENFPSGDAEKDTARINALFEAQVRLIPEQYLWVHRRFKSRPTGSKGVY